MVTSLSGWSWMGRERRERGEEEASSKAAPKPNTACRSGVEGQKLSQCDICALDYVDDSPLVEGFFTARHT